MSDWCYRLNRTAARLVSPTFARLHVWRVDGATEPTGSAVLVSNHISHFDPVLLSVVFSRAIDWMTTEEFYSHSLGGAWLRALNTFPVDRTRPDRRALRLGLARLHSKRLIGVFPEGGIRAGPTSILGGAAPKSGAVALARLAEVPILPCVIFGSDRLYAHRNWIPLRHRVPIWVTVGKSFLPVGGGNAVANQCLTSALRELGAAAIAHFNLASDDLPASPQHRKGRDADLTNQSA